MTRAKIDSFTKGWFIGDFAPTMMKTTEFETAMKTYKKGDFESAHVHKVATEFTIIGTGKFRMNDMILVAGDIVQLAPGEIADFECLEDGVTFVVKTPSAPFDKELVKR